MQSLEKSLRNQLERTVKSARDIAEEAAKSALEQLGVGEASPFSHLSEDERKLRRKLRTHGRQLGDYRDPQKETQEIYRLIEEVAYEHWHRMLFARFLAENNLLMYPDPVDPVPVTLEECEDLASDEGAKNGWELAARYAAQMLPQIFRLDSPVFALTLPPEHQQHLEKLLTDLPIETFEASDSLGWVYQFWQAKRKEEVNASEVKIGARELPAVTQLFTEPYMVSFLLDNSLGAWWAGKRLTEDDFRTAKSEEELREKAALYGIPLEYLRFVKDDKEVWSLASGTFEQWPEHLSELKTLDPSCGSGHFLVAAMLMLIPMRMEMEGLSASETVNAVLRDNINGLDIDPRVTEIAAFALAITAWRVGGYQELPELNIACSGLSVSAKKSEWLALTEGNIELEGALDKLYDLFKDAPVLGSLLNPSQLESSLFSSGYDNVAQLLENALKNEQNDIAHEAGITAHGLAKAANLLTGKYQWVITNVPYLARGKQNNVLKDFSENNYPEAKTDLATVFLDRCLEYCSYGGNTSVVLPQNWLFLGSYKKFREKLLKNNTWNLIGRLGPQAFQTPMWDFNVLLINLSKGLNGSNFLSGIDVSEPRTVDEKAFQLINHELKTVEQTRQLENPDARIALDKESNLPLFSQFADALVGLQTGDDPRFIANFWEVFEVDHKTWEFMQNTPNTFNKFSGLDGIVKWENGDGVLLNNSASRPTQGLKALGQSGIAIHRMQKLFPYYFGKERLHQNVAVIIPKDANHLDAIWAYCSSPEYNDNVRGIDQALKVTNATLVKVPFDFDRWSKIGAEKYPNGLPKPHSDDPAQWIFHGHPCGSVIWDENQKWTVPGAMRKDNTVLQISVARLLGYQWPAELDAEMDLADEQREWVEKSKALSRHVDDDGIVCLPAIRGEKTAHERLLSLLADAYGSEWSNDILTALLKNSDAAGKTHEFWLREKFFTQHCKLFGHRPFVWHIWDGLKDGFAALVNYHKLDYKTLETLIYTYLGDWITRQKQDIANGIDGAQEKLVAAEQLKKRLELILEGEEPYDIFVRWKPPEEQPIGWNPDLNDGVRLNIRPFMNVADVGKKGAGVLRDKPNIKWGKDRGKDVESAPWYNLGLEYSGKVGDRINDHHLTLIEKKSAKEKNHA